MKRLYCPFSKTEESDDGTLKVWGYASTGAVDEDGETILPEAIKAALPDYLKWGAVREMHQPKAVGTAIEADVQADGRTWFGAHVVDPIAVKKIKNNVLKGFSVGGRITDRDEVEKTTITGLKLIEVSLVDRPANPECEIIMVKRSPEAAVDDLAQLLTKGSVDPESLLDLLNKDEDKKPYGDVEYADPGYQEDKKKRYPIDTEAHIRAAWNYINKEKNQEQYTSSQVASIKRRIIAAWKKKIDKDGPPSAQKEKVAKGVYNVAQFAQALEALAWVAMGAQSDFDWEGDGSPVPGKLRECMADLAEIFAEMAEEEADELVESLKEQAGEAIERVLKGVDMELNLAAVASALKAGAKFSKETKAGLDGLGDHLKKMHKAAKDYAAMCKEACDKHAKVMGSDGEEDDEAEDRDGKDAAAQAAAARAAQARSSQTAAAMGEETAEALAGIIGEAMSRALDARLSPMQKVLELVLAQPAGGGMPATAQALEALRAAGVAAVSKDGATGDIGDFKPVTLAGGTVDEGATLVKALLHPSRKRFDIQLGGGDNNLLATQLGK